MNDKREDRWQRGKKVPDAIFVEWLGSSFPMLPSQSIYQWHAIKHGSRWGRFKQRLKWFPYQVWDLPGDVAFYCWEKIGERLDWFMAHGCPFYGEELHRHGESATKDELDES